MNEAEMLNKVLEIFPHATLGEDNDGQLVIYTDCHYDDQGNIVPMPEDL